MRNKYEFGDAVLRFQVPARCDEPNATAKVDGDIKRTASIISLFILERESFGAQNACALRASSTFTDNEWIYALVFQLNGVTVAAADDAAPTEFAPQVTATCKTGTMNIRIAFNGSYNGAVHARDFRTKNCMEFGDGSNSVRLSLNLLSRHGHPDYCGILVHNVSGEVRTN